MSGRSSDRIGRRSSSVANLPAVLGGSPLFEPPLPFARPTFEDPERIMSDVAASLESGIVTNGPRVAELEERAARLFGVDHCIAVASCTLGLMLVTQALAENGAAVAPSFTFSATAHALAWNGLQPEFVDCDPNTWCLRAEDIPDHATFVIGVHVSGVPCDVEALQRRSDQVGATLIFDAAHGAGSLVTSGDRLRPLGGFGRAEVFSLTPTKVLSGSEGGLVTTDDPDLASRIRTARDYGNPGDYDTRFVGLNARLSELNAAAALASIDHLESRVSHRNEVARLYQRRLGELPGIGYQQVPEGARSSYKDFTILVDGEAFGASRGAVVDALAAEGVPTRPYYSPPVHRQTAYAHLPPRQLPVTDRLARQVISLPIWSHLPLETVDRIAEAFFRIHHHAEQVEAAGGRA